MTYADQSGRVAGVPAAPTTTEVIEYHDRVRWGPVLAGLVVALGTQLVLSSLGAAFGLNAIANSGAPRSDAGDVGSAVGLWSIISLFASVFVGGWVTARTSGPITRNGSLFNGAILWATTLSLGAYLLASGVSGALGVLGSNPQLTGQAQNNVPAGVQAPTAEQTRNVAGNAAKGSLSFAVGSLLGLAAALSGAYVGAKRRMIEEV